MIVQRILETTPEANKIFADLENNQQLLNALEWHWVNGNNSMSSPYWSDKIGSDMLVKFTYAMSKAGWLVSYANPRAKWGEFHLDQKRIDKEFTAEEQLTYRTKARIKKYSMRYKENFAEDMVKTATGIKATGLIRKGFAKCSNLPFKLDVAPMAKYYDAILLNLTKSMDKVMVKHPTISNDTANYAVISKELLDYYIFNEDTIYNLEGNTSDSRGRAIYNGLKRVGNPISNKDFRSCMVVPQGIIIDRTDRVALREVYLFIAELTGSNAKSWNGKMLSGLSAFHNRALHDLDLTDEHDRKDLHENIWLERMYAKLEQIEEHGSVYWDIPLEVDATMSLGQIAGILTNDARLLDRTNVINETTLLDAWHVEGVPRLHTKTVGTPTFYGSAQSAVKLLKSKKLDYTREQITILNKEFSKGAFGVVKGLKDFLIQNANVDTPTIQMEIWDDKFEVPVNKFKAVGAKVNAYTVYDSTKKRKVTFINHDTIKVPDYERFKLYYPTCLI